LQGGWPALSGLCAGTPDCSECHKDGSFAGNQNGALHERRFDFLKKDFPETNS
jgi:hypothetical protein